MNYGRRNVFPFKGNAEYFGVWCRSPFVIRTIKRVFAWQWKFMVALLCPNNSHIVSRTDSPCRKQQACYQSHIFAYCETSPPLPPSSTSSFFFFFSARQKHETANIWRNKAAFIWTFFFFFNIIIISVPPFSSLPHKLNWEPLANSRAAAYSYCTWSQSWDLIERKLCFLF